MKLCTLLPEIMASQLLPLGSCLITQKKPTPLTHFIELIDKCVGSRIWVVMKGDKGQPQLNTFICGSDRLLTPIKNSPEPCSVSMTTSVSIPARAPMVSPGTNPGSRHGYGRCDRIVSDLMFFFPRQPYHSVDIPFFFSGFHKTHSPCTMLLVLH